MKAVLSKFVKNITIQEYFCTLHSYHLVQNVRALSGYFLKDSMKELVLGAGKNKIGSGRIVVTDHAFQRWGERVSIPSLNRQGLQTKLNFLHGHLGRIELHPNGVGEIDREILFTYRVENDDVIITTFYGRLSQIHPLHQFEALRSYNAHSDDFVGLSLSSELLRTLPEPPVPAIRMIFQGRTTTYLLEKYTDGSLDLFVLAVVEGPGSGVVREFFSDQPDCEKLEKSVRRALLLFGDDEFVYRHIAFHHPLELQKQMDRVKSRYEKTP